MNRFACRLARISKKSAKNKSKISVNVNIFACQLARISQKQPEINQKLVTISRNFWGTLLIELTGLILAYATYS